MRKIKGKADSFPEKVISQPISGDDTGSNDSSGTSDGVSRGNAVENDRCRHPRNLNADPLLPGGSLDG